MMVRAYMIPFMLGRCLAIGGEEGYLLKGPILYVPEGGALFYESSLRGDVDRWGVVVVGIDFFSDELSELICQQMTGRLIEGYRGEKINLSEGVVEADFSGAEFRDIAAEAKTAYTSLDKFRRHAFDFIIGLEEKLQG